MIMSVRILMFLVLFLFLQCMWTMPTNSVKEDENGNKDGVDECTVVNKPCNNNMGVCVKVQDSAGELSKVECVPVEKMNDNQNTTTFVESSGSQNSSPSAEPHRNAISDDIDDDKEEEVEETRASESGKVDTVNNQEKEQDCGGDIAEKEDEMTRDFMILAMFSMIRAKERKWATMAKRRLMKTMATNMEQQLMKTMPTNMDQQVMKTMPTNIEQQLMQKVLGQEKKMATKTDLMLERMIDQQQTLQSPT